MFFEVCKHVFDRLTAQPLDRFGFLCLQPGLRREDDVFVCAAPNTAAALLARRALRPQRAGVAGCTLAPIAHDDFLTPPTPHIGFASRPLEHLPRGTPIRLQLGQPLALRFGEKRLALGILPSLAFQRPYKVTSLGRTGLSRSLSHSRCRLTHPSGGDPSTDWYAPA